MKNTTSRKIGAIASAAVITGALIAGALVSGSAATAADYPPVTPTPTATVTATVTPTATATATVVPVKVVNKGTKIAKSVGKGKKLGLKGVTTKGAKITITYGKTKAKATIKLKSFTSKSTKYSTSFKFKKAGTYYVKVVVSKAGFLTVTKYYKVKVK